MTERLDPQAVAEKAAEAMYAADSAAQAMGITLDAIAPGYAKMSMTVREDMLNGHKTCHGGFFFALADTAFAFGCNAYNMVTVAQGCEIDYLKPGKLGDRLTAECTEQAVAGRSGVYYVTITNQDGETLSLFRGKSRRIKGEIVPGLTVETEE